jgi:hypothetical protein
MVPRWPCLWLRQPLVGCCYQVVAAELLLLLLLLLLLRPGGWNLSKLLLGLPLAEGDDLLPVCVVGSQIEELPDDFQLNSPYLMDKGLARGTVLEAMMTWLFAVSGISIQHLEKLRM